MYTLKLISQFMLIMYTLKLISTEILMLTDEKNRLKFAKAESVGARHCLELEEIQYRLPSQRPSQFSAD